MFGIEIGCSRPWYLLLLTLLPLLWIASYRSLSGLGPYRRLFALGLRTLVFSLIVCALAELQMVRTSDKVTVTYLLDQSESIPVAGRQAMLDYVQQAVALHRRAEREDCAGVIVFGRDAMVEIPPFDDDIPFINLESAVGLRTDATNLSAALKLAGATFPEDSARRIVIVSDGNENVGDARTVARGLVEQGIGIDIVPVELPRRGEVQVDKVVLPSDIRRGQPIDARVVINNLTSDDPREERSAVRGQLKLLRESGSGEELLNPTDQQIELKAGKNVFSFPHEIDEVDVYTYKAVFTPDDAQDDRISQNNEATAFTHVRGKGRVLFIEDAEHPGEFDFLIERLKQNNIEVALQSSDALFTSLPELQAYDCVVLGNVPRSSGVDAESTTSFSDDQIRMLVRNTEQFGCGLVMLGGPNAFGAGGWSNTEIEEAMPVDFQIRNTRVRAVGALVMIMHASEMAQGNHWQKVVAQEAITPLGPMDYCGLIHWGPGKEEWLWQENGRGLIRVGDRQRKLRARVDRMTPGDMPAFDPAMKMALAALNSVPASAKHMIVISDGDPAKPSMTTMSGFRKAEITVSTVAIGAHGTVGHNTLKDIATQTGGKYYPVKNPKALPRIFQIESRKVAQPLVKDLADLPPRIVYPHEMLQGIDEPLPPLKGFVMTTVKDSPLVEVAIRSPDPEDPENATILAAWTYGMGRTVAMTTDAGRRWADRWTEWPDYDKFFSQMIRWAMRPTNRDGKYTASTDVKDGKIRVVVTALDKDDEFLNLLQMTAVAVDPKLAIQDVRMEQVAPGRYVGEFPADQAGSYFLNVIPEPGAAPILAGVNVPYSSEFRDRETNAALLESLASLAPVEGQPGTLIRGPLDRGRMEPLLAVDPFRPGLPSATSRQDIWPWVLVACGCVFFCDVLVRRVTLRFDWIGPAVRSVWFKLRGQPRDGGDDDQRIERLRSRKAEIAEQIDERRAAVRFEDGLGEDGSAVDQELDEVVREASSSGQAAPRPASRPETPPEADEAAGYTARLLDAKKRAMQDRKQ